MEPPKLGYVPEKITCIDTSAWDGDAWKTRWSSRETTHPVTVSWTPAPAVPNPTSDWAQRLHTAYQAGMPLPIRLAMDAPAVEGVFDMHVTRFDTYWNEEDHYYWSHVELTCENPSIRIELGFTGKRSA